MKRKNSSDSPVIIQGNVNTKGDAAIGSNAKIIKTIKENKGLSLFEILVGLATVFGTIIAIYSFYKGK